MQRLRNVSLNKQHPPRFIIFHKYLFLCWFSVLIQRCDWMPMVFRVSWDHIYRLPNPPNGYNILYYYPSLDFASRSGTCLLFPSLRADAVCQRIFIFILVGRVSSRESARLRFDKILKLFLLQWMRSFSICLSFTSVDRFHRKITVFWKMFNKSVNWDEIEMTDQSKQILRNVRADSYRPRKITVPLFRDVTNAWTQMEALFNWKNYGTKQIFIEF